MRYASPKDALKKTLSGINEEYQASEITKWARDVKESGAKAD